MQRKEIKDMEKNEQNSGGSQNNNTQGSGNNEGSSQNNGSSGNDGRQNGGRGQLMAPPEMNCSDETNCEAPEPPDGFDGEMPEGFDGGMPAEIMGGRMGMRGELQQTNSDAILHPAAYLAIGGASVVLGIIISYACFSKFFHLKPARTFSTRTRFIWFIAVATIVAVGICLLGYFIPVWTK